MSMELSRGNDVFEALNRSLNDQKVFDAYRVENDGHHASFLPRMLGRMLIWFGNVVYGSEPSYLKFRAVEVIARVPYHSWASVAYTLLTRFYTDEKKATTLSELAKYARFAQDNETMHVVVISQLEKDAGNGAGLIRHSLIPMLFAFIYFWKSYLLYLIKPRYSYELNYLFEQHAFLQYDRFLTTNETELKSRPVNSQFLAWYGRSFANQYEFFRSVRNDELIHRNMSLQAIKGEKK